MGKRIAFIGGGNMASAIIGGLLRQGFSAADIDVVEPWDEARARLAKDFGLAPQAEAGAFLAGADMIVWAVKPQTFKEAAAAVRAHNQNALHLSVAAGITSQSIAQWLGSERIIRTMPNTPALIRQRDYRAGTAARPSPRRTKTGPTKLIATTGATVSVYR